MRTLIRRTQIEAEESVRKQISSVEMWAYWTLKKQAKEMNKTYTKSILADACLRLHNKPTVTYVGKREEELDKRLKQKYYDNIVSQIESVKKKNRYTHQLDNNVPPDVEDNLYNMELRLMPSTVEECLTGYRDNNTVEEAVNYAHHTPFKSRLDRIECKEQLLKYPDQQPDHHVAVAIIQNSDDIEGTEYINIKEEWYTDNDLTLEKAKTRVDEFGRQDKDKKLLALKSVCKNQIIDKEGVTITANKLYNCSTKTAKEYADCIIRSEKQPQVENIRKSKKALKDNFNDYKEAKRAHKLLVSLKDSDKTKQEVKTLCNNRDIDHNILEDYHIDYTPKEVTAFTDDKELRNY